jgi:hypothetical protein
MIESDVGIRFRNVFAKVFAKNFPRKRDPTQNLFFPHRRARIGAPRKRIENKRLNELKQNISVNRAPHAPTRANRTAKSSPDLILHAWIIMPAPAAGRVGVMKSENSFYLE